MLVPHVPPRHPPPSTTFPVSPSLPPPKATPHPTRGRLTMLVSHPTPRHPPPSTTSSTPPYTISYTILYIEGSPYPITEYPPYIME